MITIQKNKGITLMELIAVIVVLGMAIPVLLGVWANVAWRASRSEAVADATFYGDELMEWVIAKRFDEKTTGPWTNSASFGVDSGESSANMNTYDDVDDFVGSTDPAVTKSPGGYIRSVTVQYVTLNTGVTPNAWNACGATTCAAVSDCTSCAQCCYKRIVVTVSRNDGLLGGSPVTLTTIVHQ